MGTASTSLHLHYILKYPEILYCAAALQQAHDHRLSNSPQIPYCCKTSTSVRCTRLLLFNCFTCLFTNPIISENSNPSNCLLKHIQTTPCYSEEDLQRDKNLSSDVHLLTQIAVARICGSNAVVSLRL